MMTPIMMAVALAGVKVLVRSRYKERAIEGKVRYSGHMRRPPAITTIEIMARKNTPNTGQRSRAVSRRSFSQFGTNFRNASELEFFPYKALRTLAVETDQTVKVINRM